MEGEIIEEGFKKKKRNPNFWLEDSEFIKNSKFPDKYYFETLCYHISSMLKNEPIPILATYDSKHNAVYLSIGNEKRGWDIDVNTAYYDMITLMKQWTSTFYPSYEIEYEDKVELTEDEIREIIKTKKMTLMEAFDERKIVIKKEIGVIEKVFFPEDQFLINVNGKREFRIAGSGLNSFLKVKMFMEKLRSTTDHNEKRIYIFDNSRFVKEAHDSTKEILINYSGKQMLKFFEINFPVLTDKELLPTDDKLVYKWGRYSIKFESPILMTDCLSYYAKRKSLS